MKIINEDLCCGCGACEGICPVNALFIDSKKTFKPTLDKKKCIQCNLCFEVCPGKGWNPVQQAKIICEQENIEMDLNYGPVKNYYMGKAIDEKINEAGASGGIGTELLLYLLEKNIVDKIVCVVLEGGIPKVKITNKPEVVLKAAGSKYSPVPVVKEIIRELKGNSKRKIAITVLPCHMAAIENYLRINKCLDRKSIYAIGLFCGDLKEYESIQQISNNLNIKDNDISEFLGWRYGKWPGKASFKLKDGKIKGKELQKWLGISRPFYALHRCLMCPSRENWLTDIALADNHKGKTNETVIISRTKKGNDILEGAAKEGYITLEQMDKNNPDRFNVTLTKFIPALSYIEYRKKRNLPVPRYDYITKQYLNTNKTVSRYLITLKYRLFITVRNKYILKIIKYSPKLMEKIGVFVNSFPTSIPGYNTLIKIKRILVK
jgi:coenzyme F420 hydrogenase subunit beta